MIYGYARVSTKSQAKESNSLEAQVEILKSNGATKIYSDAFTGTKSNRPEFNELLREISNGDTLIITKLDRFARSLAQGSTLVSELLEKGITVNILNIGIMDQSPSSTLIRNIFFSFAEFERQMIVERTQEGKAIARTKEGYREGRPPKYCKAKLDLALNLLDAHSYTDVEKMTGISKSTLIRAQKRIHF